MDKEIIIEKMSDYDKYEEDEFEKYLNKMRWNLDNTDIGVSEYFREVGKLFVGDILEEYKKQKSIRRMRVDEKQTGKKWKK